MNESGMVGWGWCPEFFAIGTVCMVVGLADSSAAQEEATQKGVAQETVDQLVGKLSPENHVDQRLGAAQKLLDMEGERPLPAVDALIKGFKDENPLIRRKYAIATALILSRNKKRCPKALVELLFDSDEDVRYNTELVLTPFESFEPACFPLVFKFFSEADEETKRNNYTVLAAAGGTDERVMKILSDALEGGHVGGRLNATAAMWSATKDLEVYVPLLIDRINDAQNYIETRPRDYGEQKEDSAQFHFFAIIGASGVYHTHFAEREQDLMGVIRKLARDDSLDVRRGLANWLRIAISYAVPDEESEEVVPTNPPATDVERLRPILESLLRDTDENVKKYAQESLDYLDEIRDHDID